MRSVHVKKQISESLQKPQEEEEIEISEKKNRTGTFQVKRKEEKIAWVLGRGIKR